MTLDQEIRAKALELAQVHHSGAEIILARAELWSVYIRDGMEACAGMLKMPPWNGEPAP